MSPVLCIPMHGYRNLSGFYLIVNVQINASQYVELRRNSILYYPL